MHNTNSILTVVDIRSWRGLCHCLLWT